MELLGYHTKGPEVMRNIDPGHVALARPQYSDFVLNQDIVVCLQELHDIRLGPRYTISTSGSVIIRTSGSIWVRIST